MRYICYLRHYVARIEITVKLWKYVINEIAWERVIVEIWHEPVRTNFSYLIHHHRRSRAQLENGVWCTEFAKGKKRPPNYLPRKSTATRGTTSKNNRHLRFLEIMRRCKWQYDWCAAFTVFTASVFYSWGLFFQTHLSSYGGGPQITKIIISVLF